MVCTMTLFPTLAGLIPRSSMLIRGEIKRSNEQSDKRQTKCNHRKRISEEKTTNSDTNNDAYMRERKFNCLIWLAVYACC